VILTGKLPSLNLSIEPEKIRELLFIIFGATAPLREVTPAIAHPSSTSVSEVPEQAQESSSIQANFEVSELSISIEPPKRGPESNEAPLLKLEILKLNPKFTQNMHGTEFSLDVSRYGDETPLLILSYIVYL
jgi:hypothetical protein